MRKYSWILLIIAFVLFRRHIRNHLSPRRKRVPKDAAVLITGCDTGFGYEACIVLAKKGFKVYAGCLTDKGKEKLESQGISNLQPFILNVTKEDQIQECAEMIKRECPQGLFALVNNAGIQDGALVDWTTASQIRNIVEVNFLGTAITTKYLLESIIKGKGRIINIASLSSVIPLPSATTYTATKAAVLGWGNALRIELRPLNVDVISILPGFMKTAIVADAGKKFAKIYEGLSDETKKRYGPNYFDKLSKLVDQTHSNASNPQLVVDKICHAVSSPSPNKEYYVGIDGFFGGNFPTLAAWISSSVFPAPGPQS